MPFSVENFKFARPHAKTEIVSIRNFPEIMPLKKNTTPSGVLSRGVRAHALHDKLYATGWKVTVHITSSSHRRRDLIDWGVQLLVMTPVLQRIYRTPPVSTPITKKLLMGESKFHSRGAVFRQR
jgi:hypothetical protein